MASRRIYWNTRVSHGITADLWEYEGVSWHHGGFIGIRGCLAASRRIYVDTRVSLGITADLLEYEGVSRHHGGYM